MTALAQIFRGMGKTVWGSDVAEPFFTDAVLRRSKIKVLPFDAKNITKEIDLLVYSTAYGPSNPEFVAAKKLGVKMLSYPEALGLLFAGKYGIAVCGTHGKTTTTAMLGYVLQELKADPLVVVGSEVKQLGGNARFGKGKYFVVEADEYQNKLKHYSPRAVILTSADWDHPDYFKNQKAYNQVFKDFVRRIPKNGLLVAFSQDKNVREIIKSAKCKVVKYGYCLPATSYQLLIPGEHNLWNASAVLTLIAELGLDVVKVQKILTKFKGCKRRFELMGEKRGVKIYDDYAHHPTEVQKLLEAARGKFPKDRIWAVFQAHTYTRTKALLKDFGRSFQNADRVVILPIFGSAREAQGTVSPKDLVREINRHSHNASYRGKITEAAEYLKKQIKPGDIVICIGAGENWKVGKILLAKD